MKILLFVLVMTVSSVATARGMMDDLDTNDDKKVTKEEFSTHRAKLFAEIDTDKNGAISKDEFVNGSQSKFTKKDKNGDGVIDDADKPKRKAKQKQ
jgi:Ca2+-binding EF-hand superfamily protein